jgi:hypothetical protein
MKSTISLASRVILLAGLLCQTAHAQSSLSSLLAPDAPIGVTSPPQEFLSVLSTVTPVGGGVYLYSYILSNPTGDELMNPDGSLQAGTSEVVDFFQVSFNASAPGAVVGGPYGGIFAKNDAANGVYWLFNDVTPGSSSAPMSFYSDIPPTLGNAQAADSTLPSPWATLNAGGQPVLIPNTITPVPEPGTWALFGLAGVLVLSYSSPLRKLVAAR